MNAPREPPHNQNAEDAVIGGVLFHGRAIADVGHLNPVEFYDPRAEAIFAAMLELERKSKPIDLVTVGEEMRRIGTMAKLAAAGGEAYLAELANKMASVENIAEYAGIVRSKASVRRMLVVANEIVNKGYADNLEAEDYIYGAQQAVFDASTAAIQTPYRAVGQTVPAVLKQLDARSKAGGGLKGMSTGYTELDALLCGLEGGLFYLIAARPAMGKTALTMCIAENLTVSQDEPVLVFSLEMKRELLTERLLAARARVSLQDIRHAKLDSSSWMRLAQAGMEIDRAPLYIDDTSSPTIAEVRTKTRRWRADPAIFPKGTKRRGLAIIDYLQLVQGTPKKNGNREQEISEISRGLKSLAMDLDMPVIALSQLNRDVEKRSDNRPMLSDLRESGSLEQDADAVCFVYRDEVYHDDSPDRGVAEIIVGKQRQGPPDTVRLAFLDQYTRFENLAPEHRA